MIDSKIQNLLKKEIDRLNNDIELIASENYPSQDILDLMGSNFSVKYSEGFPAEVSKQGRHYAGCQVIDELENYAIENACKLFDCKYANVQPWSGSQANLAVYAGLLNPGDKVLGMDLNAGGHLTHFSKASDSSKEYTAITYGLDENGFLNYKEIEEKLYKYQPRLLVVGASAYSRIIDFEKIRKIVDKSNEKLWQQYLDTGVEAIDNLPIKDCYEKYKCYLMVDMAHIAGLVATGIHPSPLPYADVVTTTTHKTLRGPRGGLILWNDQSLCAKLNAGVFPRTQGGSNQATIAAKCQCFLEAQTGNFKKYTRQIVLNMNALIKGIRAEDTNKLFDFVSGGSDNHLVLVDISKTGLFGKEAENKLTSFGIICNKNMIKNDTKPSECTGIRLGTAAITTRGFDEKMCFRLGQLIVKILMLKENEDPSVIDLNRYAIEKELKEMLDKVGPFYKTSTDFVPNSPDIA